MIQSLVSSLKGFKSLDQFSLVHRAVPLPVHGASGGTKARTAQTLVTLGDAWGNPGVPQPLQSQGQAQHCSHRRHCFITRESGEGSLAKGWGMGMSLFGGSWRRRGVTVNPTCVQQPRGAPQMSALLGQSDMEPKALLSAQSPCLPRLWSVSVLHWSLQFSRVKKTGCLEVILPVFWWSSRTGLLLHQKKLIWATCILGISAGFDCNLPASNLSI